LRQTTSSVVVLLVDNIQSYTEMGGNSSEPPPKQVAKFKDTFEKLGPASNSSNGSNNISMIYGNQIVYYKQSARVSLTFRAISGRGVFQRYPRISGNSAAKVT
jgi:hypothetical protein